MVNSNHLFPLAACHKSNQFECELELASTDRQISAHLYKVHYQALWEALIVRLELIFDRTKGANSLKFVAQQLAKLDTADAHRVAVDLRDSVEVPHPQRAPIAKWRSNVVAHRRINLDTEAFDLQYPLHIKNAQDSLELAERLLNKAAVCIGDHPWYFAILKEETFNDARMFLRSKNAA